MRRWPDILPGPSAAGYELSPVDQSIRSDMEVGPKRTRRITSEDLDTVKVTVILSDAEMKAFRAFHKDAYWSAAGDSDDLTGWTLQNVTINDDATVGPDGALADKIVEEAINGTHFAQVDLDDLAINNITIVGTATLQSAGRQYHAVGIDGRDGVFRHVVVKPNDGEVVSSPSATAVMKDRGDDFWRVTVTAVTGSGGATPKLRVQPMFDASTFSYMGDGSGVHVCEVSARETDDGFLRTDADGNVLGAAGGSAWFEFPIAVGGGLTYVEAQFLGPYTAPASAGLLWSVSFVLQVRNA